MISLLQRKRNKMEEDTVYSPTQCIHCSKVIHGKPWISVKHDSRIVNACGYSCSNHLSKYVGVGYFDKIVNKEDFNEPRPITTYKKVDITSNSYFDRRFRDMIDQEQAELDSIFNTYQTIYDESSTSDDGGEYSD